MKATTLLADAVERRVSAARELGVELGRPLGPVTLTADGCWLAIGAVIIYPDGEVEAAPCRDCTAEQVLVVLGHGERARLSGPEAAYWVRVRDIGWVASIFEPAGVPE